MPLHRTHHDDQKIANALSILSHREQLVWHANARHESIPQTTLHFETILYEMDRPGAFLGVDVRRPKRVDAKYGEKLPECFRLRRRGKAVGKGKERVEDKEAVGRNREREREKEKVTGSMGHQRDADEEMENIRRRVKEEEEDSMMQDGVEGELTGDMHSSPTSHSRRHGNEQSSATSTTGAKRKIRRNRIYEAE